MKNNTQAEVCDKQFTQEELQVEIWKDIEGYEGSYLVSSLGRVKSFMKYKDGRILKGAPDK